MSYLYRTANFGSSNDSSCVLSFWVKKTVNHVAQGLFLGWNTSSNYATCYVNTDDTIYYKEKQGGTQYETRITSGARKFRDINAWYHFVFQWDYTQATASNRIKVWINGELQTWENTGNLPPQNNSLRLKSSDFRIGDYTHAGSSYFNWKGLMSHVHFIDDAPYDTYQASTFGETDSTTGEWKIKTNPGIATNNYGSQGFFVLKDGNSGTDQSGKGNNLSTSGTITKTEDCPSNVFATWNPLARFNGNFNFSNGNTSVSAPSGTWNGSIATMGFNSGKWYWEAKFSGNADNQYIGVFDESANTATNNPMNRTGTTAFYNYDGGEMVKDGSVTTADYGTITSSQICGVAVDADNNTISIYRDGVAIVSNYALSTTKNLLFPFISVYNTTADYNFGNGYFGTTAVSSPGTNASNNGIFEYDVPSGYTALSTKGLNL